jgi:hypothetical protein
MARSGRPRRGTGQGWLRWLGPGRLVRLLVSLVLALVLSTGAWPLDPRLSNAITSAFPGSDNEPQSKLALDWSGAGGGMPALCNEATGGAPVCLRPQQVARCIPAGAVAFNQASTLAPIQLRQSACRRFHRPFHYPLRIGGANAEDAEPLSV